MVTEEFAQFITSTTFDQLPPIVIDGAICALDRVLSLSATRRHDPLVKKIVATTAAIATDDVLPFAGQLRPPYAALALGAAATLGLDEDSLLIERLACCVVPTAFILASATAPDVSSCTGDQLVLSVGLGLECALRTAKALGNSHVARGWDPVGSAGRIGATVAAGVIVGLTTPELVNALGFASTTVAGLRVGGGSLLALGAGKAALDAIEAASLAKHGLVGPPLPLEGRRGLFALVAKGADARSLVQGLGAHWSVTLAGEPLVLHGPAGQLVHGDVDVLANAYAMLCESIN